GRRCFVLPCVFGPPPALWRFTMPWKPCPLDVPVTFTVSPTANTSTFTRSPTLYEGICAFALPGSSSRTLRSTRGGASSPAFFAWPTAASVARCPFGAPSPRFDARRSRDVPSPSCTELYPAFAGSVTATTGFGGASITVTGICCPASLKIWVMPSFLPTMPIIESEFPGESLRGGAGWPNAVGLWDWPVCRRTTICCRPGAADRCEGTASQPIPFRTCCVLLHLDLDVDTGRQIQLGQRVHRLRARVEDVDHAFVRLQLELLARLLV